MRMNSPKYPRPDRSPLSPRCWSLSGELASQPASRLDREADGRTAPFSQSGVSTFAASVSALTLASALWLEATAAFAGNSATVPAFAQPTPPAASQLEKHPRAPAPSANSYNGRGLKTTAILGFADKIATLHAIDRALSSVADGGAFVWERGNGNLRGLIRPTTSFKSSSGEVCRHIIIRLDTARLSREVEGIACRSHSGVWTLSG